MKKNAEKNAGAANSDLRLYARFDCGKGARLESDAPKQSYTASIVDIGLGGVQVHSHDPIPVDQTMTLWIDQEGEIVLRVEGIVRYCSKDGDGFASGFKFAPKSHHDRVGIAEFVHSIFQRQWELAS